jgi:uncharacterized protein
MSHAALALTFALAFAAAPAAAAAPAPAQAYEIPYLTGRVVDEAKIISPDERDRLTGMLKAHEQATTNQIVVLTASTIGQTSIEEYAVKVFEAWKLGQKGKDNGVLVVVVPQDRKMRIEVGYGLESTLPDGAAGEIIRTWMTPAFKAGNYDKGIEDGVAAVVARLEGRGGPVDRQPAGPPSSPTSSSRPMANGFAAAPMPIGQRLLIGAFIFGMLGIFTVVGIATPGVGWFIYVFMLPFWAIFPIIIVGLQPTLYLLATYLVGYPVAKLYLGRQEWYKKSARELKTSGRTSFGGFVMTSGGGSSGSNWSSGGGDSFSGGGGDSGGGGASGSW